MSVASTGFSIAMNASETIPHKVELTETGIHFREELSFEEWAALGQQISRAGRSLGFLIGDWINYGEARKEFGEKYAEALKATGLDYSTLKTYSRVARRVNRELRVTQLSFEHHRKVAMLEPEEQRRWLRVASEANSRGEPLSTRRLAKSILIGRVARDDELRLEPADRGIDNHIPWINRLVAWWGAFERSGWFDNASPEQVEALSRDFEQVRAIIDRIDGELQRVA
jgi:AAA+ ATPase superfamily predicted ATPase